MQSRVGGAFSRASVPSRAPSAPCVLRSVIRDRLNPDYYPAARSVKKGNWELAAANKRFSNAAAVAADECQFLPVDVDMSPYQATLLIQCCDRKGVVAALAQLLSGLSCNILQSDQYSERDSNTFFQRVYFDYSDLTVGTGNLAVLENCITELAAKYGMEWQISYGVKKKQVALLVSKYDHCLFDLLVRHKDGDLNCDIPVIISNHSDLKGVAATFGVDFKHVPAEKGKKQEHESQIEEILQDVNADLIVLARYMQILSPEFCESHWRHTINIHHSFLPAFEGAKPYHRAQERGVKIIGATAHYATSDLDCGPIIEQDVTRITHRDSVQDMIRKGRDLERVVLARAVRWHLDDRILVHENRTVVFED